MLKHRVVVNFTQASMLVVALVWVPFDAVHAQWKIIVDGPSANPTGTESGLSATGENTFSSETQTVTVECRGDVDCRQIKLRTEHTEDAQAPSIFPRLNTVSSTAKAEFTLNRERLSKVGAKSLTIDLGTKAIKTYQLSVGAPRGTRDQTRQSTPLNDLLTSGACTPSIAVPNGRSFIVEPTGNVLASPRGVLNEGSRVYVTVISDSRLAPSIFVERKSEFRPVRVSNIQGAGIALTNTGGLNGREALDEGELKCIPLEFELADFAPGKGVVEISALTSTGKQVTGSFDFRVNELYTGAFTLGAVRTRLKDPTFGTVVVTRDTVVNNAVTRVADTLVTETKNRGERLLYILTYTPFVWGARDVTVTPPLLHRFNPTVGVVLNDIQNNGMVGISADLSNGIYLNALIHAGRVTTLDPNSGLSIGDRVGTETVPTTKQWKYRFAWGVTVDLKAALDLLKSAVATPSQ